MRDSRLRPYWLGAGGHVCSACEQSFVIEVGFHCGGCDRPLCGQCAAPDPDTGELLCLECREADEEGG